MNLYFYLTNFNVSDNGIYESLETYLSSLSPVATYEYKHIDPALSAQVKLPALSHQPTKKSIGDYCKAVDDDGTVYYYYVMNAFWKAKETLLITLGLDTLNTYASQISDSLTDRTHITRKFKDRYKTRGSKTSRYTITPVIDRVSEDFSSMPMERQSVTAINPDSFRKWTLIYLTKYENDSANLSANPVTCYAFPSTQVNVPTGATGDVTWEAGTFTVGAVYALTQGMNDGDTFTIYGNSAVTYTIGDTYRGAFFCRTASDAEVSVWIVNSSGSAVSVGSTAKVLFTKCDAMYLQSFSRSDGLYPSKVTFDTPVYVRAGSSYSTIQDFDSWYKANKTDARIVKIRELPYAPFKETYTDGQMDVPSGWETDGTGLKFTGTTFGIYSLATRTASMPIISAEDVIDQSPSIDREPKLYNSSFYNDKLVYDTVSWVARWEDASNIANGSMALSISYAVSDGMDNGSLFKITAPSFVSDTDFGEYMVVDKSTDKPYYTNEYLNYLRYGKAIDEKAAAYNVASAVVSGVGSIATTASSLAFGMAAAGASAGVGAVIGAVVGTAMAVISLSKTATTAWDSINSKIDTYTHQSSSVSGTSDVSLFNIYSGNKLLNIIYKPRDEVRTMLYNYFRQYGYANDTYEIPVSSRRWVDYFKVEPVFSGDLLWNDFLDDIKNRMQVGYRIFHLNDGKYDLLFEYENWETSLWDWAN
jgi:hypothetical protein